MANNKVQLADGTVLIDITDTTAVASDVRQGTSFYGANGVKIAGLASYDVTIDHDGGISAADDGEGNVTIIETGGGGGLKYDVGDFTLASDTTALATSNGISHNLGEVPGCVIVWQTTYTDDNVPTVQVNSGYVFLDRIMDMKQRLTSSISSARSFYASFSCSANTTTGISFGGPTSDSYMPSTNYKPTATKFGLPNMSASNRWRAGVQYHYFVSEAWWT